MGQSARLREAQDCVTQSFNKTDRREQCRAVSSVGELATSPTHPLGADLNRIINVRVGAPLAIPLRWHG